MRILSSPPVDLISSYPRYGPRLRDYLSLHHDESLVQEIFRTINKMLYAPSGLLIAGLREATGTSKIVFVVREPSQLFRQSASSLISRSKSRVLLLSCVLIILDRLQGKVSIFTNGSLSTKLGLLLAALIVAETHVLGGPLSHEEWSDFTDGQFTSPQIALMERQIIKLLDNNFDFTEASFRRRLAPFMSARRVKPRQEVVKHQRDDIARGPSVIPARMYFTIRGGFAFAPASAPLSRPTHFDWLGLVKRLFGVGGSSSSARRIANGGEKRDPKVTILAIIPFISLKQKPPKSALLFDPSLVPIPPYPRRHQIRSRV